MGAVGKERDIGRGCRAGWETRQRQRMSQGGRRRLDMSDLSKEDKEGVLVRGHYGPCRLYVRRTSIASTSTTP
jgi:hypothetical protein